MPRPKTPEHLRPVQRTVRLSPAAFDTAYRYATGRGLTVNAVMQRTLEHVFTHQKTILRADACYRGTLAGSTLSGVLGESTS